MNLARSRGLWVEEDCAQAHGATYKGRQIGTMGDDGDAGGHRPGAASGFPHHITQRGNRRQQTFFFADDYSAYIDLMAEWCGRHKVEVWAYCLMPNHVHMIAVPCSEAALRLAIGEAHRRYTRRVNFREGWRGHLWQGRFSFFVMDENYLLVATRYVEHNPVKAGLVTRPEDWQWSSALAHIAGQDDRLVKVTPLLEMVGGSWADFLSIQMQPSVQRLMRMHERTGRPLGSESFVEKLEKLLGRVLKPQRAGRKLKNRNK